MKVGKSGPSFRAQAQSIKNGQQSPGEIKPRVQPAPPEEEFQHRVYMPQISTAPPSTENAQAAYDRALAAAQALPYDPNGWHDQALENGDNHLGEPNFHEYLSRMVDLATAADQLAVAWEQASPPNPEMAARARQQADAAAAELSSHAVGYFDFAKQVGRLDSSLLWDAIDRSGALTWLKPEDRARMAGHAQAELDDAVAWAGERPYHPKAWKDEALQAGQNPDDLYADFLMRQVRLVEAAYRLAELSDDPQKREIAETYHNSLSYFAVDYVYVTADEFNLPPDPLPGIIAYTGADQWLKPEDREALEILLAAPTSQP